MKKKLRKKEVFRTVLLIFLLAALVMSVTACREKRTTAGGFLSPTKFDEDNFAAVVNKHFSASKISDSIWAKDELNKDVEEILQHTYRSNQYYPFWLDEDGNASYIDDLVKELEGLQLDGLDPERYKITRIKQLQDNFKKNKKPSLHSIIALDTICTRGYLLAAHDLLFGVVSPKEAHKNWYHDNDTAWRPDTLLVKQLYAMGRYPSLHSFRSKLPTYMSLLEMKQHYQALALNQSIMKAKNAVASDSVSADSVAAFIIKAEAPWLDASLTDTTGKADTSYLAGMPRQLLKNYQEYYNVKPTGRLDDATKELLARDPQELYDVIDVNLERLRWLPQQLEPQYVLVNVPLMELFLNKNGSNIFHMNVVVGRKERETPVLDAVMTNIVFNPSWGVPPTIMAKDIIPGMMRNGVAYLDKKDLDVYDRRGRRVSPYSVNSSNYRNYMFRQPPGDDNALGNIKFNLPNKWDIYLHDTPVKSLFGQKDRAQSSGCIRVEQPRELAEYILSDVNGKDYDWLRIEEIIQTKATKYVNLDKKIPVHIVYLTAFDNIGNQRVRFIKDIYSKDDELLSLLKEDQFVAKTSPEN